MCIVCKECFELFLISFCIEKRKALKIERRRSPCESMKVTVSLIKADVGGLVGHHVVPKELQDFAKEKLEKAKQEGVIIDYFVFNAGDDLELLMTHTKGEENPEIHGLAWNVFKEATEHVSKPMKLYGAGQDLLKDAFSGNIRGMGPGVAEMTFEERPSEPILVFAADKTEPGAWNIYLYKMFADPFNTPGLVISPTMGEGFTFEIMDLKESKVVRLNAPEDIYKMLALLGTPGRYGVRKIYRRKDGEVGASASTTRLEFIAGKYVGKDDPALVVRAQHGFPAVGEILEAFSFPYLVDGWVRGSHTGPLMPVGLKDSRCTRFDGPPRVVGLGFQLSEGRLEGPSDLFADVAFDYTRKKAMQYAEMIRRQGPFMPHRLPPDEMEYTSLTQVLKSLEDKWEKV